MKKVVRLVAMMVAQLAYTQVVMRAGSLVVLSAEMLVAKRVLKKVGMWAVR